MSNPAQSFQKTEVTNPEKVLVFQTAFLGDVILTLPLVEAIHHLWPESKIDFVVNPNASGVLENHPLINKTIVFDKRGDAKGIGGLLGFASKLRKENYSHVFVPHRSFRSALTLFLAGIRTRIGFSKTPGSFLYSHRFVRQMDQYEGARNLELISLFSNPSTFSSVPVLQKHLGTGTFPDDSSKRITMAPGSVWATKKWPEGHWTILAKSLVKEGYTVVLIGGPDDRDLCRRISNNDEQIISTAGDKTILESIELIRNSALLITNDTAPLHMGVGVNTPVLAIFGPTVPEFGFAPPGENDRVISLDLDCRPCAIHGGNSCPLGHFDCMKKLLPESLLKVANEMI